MKNNVSANPPNSVLQSTTNKAHQAKSKLKELTEFVIDVDQILKKQDYKALNQVIQTHQNQQKTLQPQQKYPELNQVQQVQNQPQSTQNNDKNMQQIEQQLNQSIQKNQELTNLIKTIPGYPSNIQQNDPKSINSNNPNNNKQQSNDMIMSSNQQQNPKDKETINNQQKQIQKLQQELEGLQFQIQHLQQELQIEKEQKENLMTQDHWLKIQTKYGNNIQQLEDAYIRCELGIFHIQLNEDNNTQLASINVQSVKDVTYPKPNYIQIQLEENQQDDSNNYKIRSVFSIQGEQVGQDIQKIPKEENLECLYLYFSNRKSFELFERFLYIECLCNITSTDRELFNSQNLMRPFYNNYIKYSLPTPYLAKIRYAQGISQIPVSENNYLSTFNYFQPSKYKNMQNSDFINNPLDPTPKSNNTSPVRQRQNVFMDDNFKQQQDFTQQSQIQQQSSFQQSSQIQQYQQQSGYQQQQQIQQSQPAQSQMTPIQGIQSFQFIDLCQQSKPDSQSNQQSARQSVDLTQNQNQNDRMNRITLLQKEQFLSSRTNISDQLKKAQMILQQGFYMIKYSPNQINPNPKLVYLTNDNTKLCWSEPNKPLSQNNNRFMKIQKIQKVEQGSGNELGFSKFRLQRHGKETLGIVVTGERILELDAVRMEDKELFISCLNIVIANKNSQIQAK